jgi:hypothetical protein
LLIAPQAASVGAAKGPVSQDRRPVNIVISATP